MDDPFCLGTLNPVSINVAHHIMAHFFFPCFRHFVIDVVFMRFQLGDLFIGNVQSQFFFRFGQRNPQAAPGFEFKLCGKQKLHLLTGITSAEGTFIIRLHTLFLH